jgi:D-glycero-alpha-D-manno-heptose-7-phosphate kinase
MEKIQEKISPIEPIETSAPCRIDMGGTLDISTFYYPLMRFVPCTFNIALDMRTRVIITPYEKGRVKISSAGFQEAEYPSGTAPFNHPLGLMFAIADYFDADGLHIEIASASPVKSALGGSSSAAVALAGALSVMPGQAESGISTKRQIATLAHHIEMITAQAICGIQDHLAAAYGGVNAWYWRPGIDGPVFKRRTIVGKKDYPGLEESILLAYCGEPHESLNINGKWAKQFIEGKQRDAWKEIIRCTHGFIDALLDRDIKNACEWMNRETDIRRVLTPDVVNDAGKKLVESAKDSHCGARFTGAGGGGCLWAYGEKEHITELHDKWQDVLSGQDGADLLYARIDAMGLLYQ